MADDVETKVEGAGVRRSRVDVVFVEASASKYEKIREVARGGMGVVSAARDLRLGREVAIKELLEPQPALTERFEREALITARLQHPGIVPVYETGRWAEGVPFYAMKLVAGRPLSEVIAATGSFEERMALIPRVLAATDAIAFAHRHGIIHRDLKPANILVGEFGETVILDWGIAKDLAAPDDVDGPGATAAGDAALTIAGSVMGTPGYMAPEQARGEPLDRRADVFSIGTILYEVLAATKPHVGETSDELMRQAAFGKTVPLERREPRVPADLLAIVTRALAPDPVDRYAEAEALADDLRRFVTGQLVAAHRYSAWQRMRRFARRHAAAVAIATISALALAIGGSVAVVRIADERDKATHRKHAGERLIDFMLSDMRAQLESIGRLDAMASIGSEVQRYYATLPEVPGERESVRMAGALEVVGRAQLASGDVDAALRTWSQGRATLAASSGPDRVLIARLDLGVGEIYYQRGELDRARATYEAARAQLGGDPRRAALALDAELLDRIGDVHRTQGHPAAALVAYREAKAKRAQTDDPLALSTSHLKLAVILGVQGEGTAALVESSGAVRLLEGLVERAPRDVRLRAKLIDARAEHAALLAATGALADALEAYRRTDAAASQLVEHDPTNAEWSRRHGNVLADLGFVLLDLGAFDDAATTLERAIAIQERLAARDPANASSKLALSRSYTRAGDAYLARGESPRALASYERGLALRERLVSSLAGSRAQAFSHAKLAGAFALAGRRDRALASYERSLELRLDVTRSSSVLAFGQELADAEIELGRYLAGSDPARSRELIVRGLERARTTARDERGPNELLVRGLVARAGLPDATGDPALRAELLREARALAEAGVSRSGSVEWSVRLAEVHAELGEWSRVREILEPLARASKLPAAQQPMLERSLRR